MKELRSHHYQALSLSDFVAQYEKLMPKARFFDLTLPWLLATEKFMVPVEQKVIVHCLFQHAESKERNQSELCIAWPLIHDEDVKGNKAGIRSLSSFYSTLAEPIFFTSVDKNNVKLLLSLIVTKYPWLNLVLGPFEQTSFISEAVEECFPYQRIFSQTDNVFQSDISDFVTYLAQRPSKLRNTLKRKANKLNKIHECRSEVITSADGFPEAFLAYKSIYQQSWKGDEFSFEFIEQVCLAAIAEDKLRLGLFYIDDKPVAAQIWFLQTTDCLDEDLSTCAGVNASIFKLAYIPEYQKLSVGSLLSLALTKYVIENDKATSIDFGMGSEPYKKDWLANNRVRNVYQVFNPQGIYGKLLVIKKVLLPRLMAFFKGS